MAFIELLLIFVLVICVTSYSYRPKERLVPLLVGIATLIISLLVLVDEIHPIRLLSRLKIDLMGAAGGVMPEEPERRETTILLLHIIAWMMGFLIFIFLVGFYISIALFTFTFLKIQGEIGWLKAALITAIVWCSIFAIFDLTMELHMFKGVLFGEILPSM
jgi:magnesium-transporting ATPase (P-type)